MGSATWRRPIVSQLSCQTRQQVFRGLSKQSQVESEKRGLNHRITAKRFSATSFIMREFCGKRGVMTTPDHSSDEQPPVQLPAIIESTMPGALTPLPDGQLIPSLVADAGEQAAWRYIDFFTSNIRNPNTRRAYARACTSFFAWCDERGLTLTTIRPYDVATYIETRGLTHSAPDVKQQLAAIRMLFDWLITGQVVPHNPAAAVRGPKHVVKTGKTPVLEAKEWRKLLHSIPTATVRNLRDRALIATLTYSFARITAALKMKVEDLRPKGAGWQLRLHEKGGKHHVMPCHHSLAEALRAYIETAGIAEDRKGFLFCTSRGHTATALSEQPMTQPDAWRMIRRRAVAAGIHAPIGNHSFRATGITAYLSNGGTLEHAQEMAAHESPRTTKLYDRTKERLTQDEVERIRL
jgi:site-specific recombinase XerD